MGPVSSGEKDRPPGAVDTVGTGGTVGPGTRVRGVSPRAGLGRGPGNRCWDAPVSPPAGTGAPSPCWPPRWRFYDFTQLWCLSTESKIQTPVVLYAAGFLVRNSE